MTSSFAGSPSHISSQSRAVLVLGMHRSGTSAVAASLQALGVYLGDRTMVGNEFNPKGYYEDMELTAVNNKLLGLAGRAWDSLALPDLRIEFAESYAGALLSARDIISRRFGGHPIWAFKDPRTTRLLSFWLEVLQVERHRPALVVVLRHPASVSDSLAARDRMPRAKAMTLWLIHQAEALAAIDRHGGAVVDYDELIADPNGVLDRLAPFLGISIQQDSKNVRTIHAFLATELCHSHYGASDEAVGRDELGRLCWRLYLHLKARATEEKCAEDACALLSDVDDYLARISDWMSCVDAYTDRERRCLELEMHLHARIADKDRELELRGEEINRLNAIVRDKDRGLADRYEEVIRLHAVIGERDQELETRCEMIARLSAALSEMEQELSSQTGHFLALRKQHAATVQSLTQTRHELAAFRGLLYRKVYAFHPHPAKAGGSAIEESLSDGAEGVQ